MKHTRLIARRDLLAAGLASAGGLLVSGCSSPLPPTYGSLLRLGDNLTYAAHRALLPGQSLVKQYRHQDISSFPAVGTADPGDPNHPRASATYRQLQQGGFADWRLSIEGLVARPGSWSLAEIKGLPSRTQITRHVCEEGWSAIAEWTGAPLSWVLDAVGLQPAARFVSFYSYDDPDRSGTAAPGACGRLPAVVESPDRPGEPTSAPPLYLGPIPLLTLLATAAMISVLGLDPGDARVWFFAIPLAIAASAQAVSLVNLLVTLVLPPRTLPRLDFCKGIPESQRTMVIVPTLLASPQDVDDLLEAMEIRYLGNRDPNLFFALLTDFRDAPEEMLPDDAALLALARRRGKHGADEAIGSVPDGRVRVAGTLISRDPWRMIEAIAVSPSAATAGESPTPIEPHTDGRDVTLRGEIVDSKCFLGVMNPGERVVHRDCAIRCLSGGVPPMLAYHDDVGRADLAVLVDAHGRLLHDALHDAVGRRITARGRLFRLNGQPVFQLASVSGVAP